jgi:predicted Co/Zn/Cd cation transporter (cation efflux family)
MLEMAPDKELYEFIKNVVASLSSKYLIEESVVRVSKVGSKLFIEIDFIVLPEKWEPTLKEQDDIREQLVIELKPLHLRKWITVSFMNNKKWALAYELEK